MVRARRWLLASLACIPLALLIGYVIGAAQTITAPPSDPGLTMASCVADHGTRIATDANQTFLNQIRALDLCARLLEAHYRLHDFNIRRIKFLQQRYDEFIMLWMVVVITISGVALAAVQLAVSYRLAGKTSADPLGQATEITVEQNRLVFKSSVTGLAILVISFAFFLVFVLEIFVIREINPEKMEGGSSAKPAGTTDVAPAPPALVGGYAPPPVPAPPAR